MWLFTPQVRAFNEHRHDACKDVIKPWHQKLDTEKYMSSDVDADLIIYIPFTEVVKLRSIVIIGGDNGEAPDKMRAFINREDVDFDRCDSRAFVLRGRAGQGCARGGAYLKAEVQKWLPKQNVLWGWVGGGGLPADEFSGFCRG